MSASFFVTGGQNIEEKNGKNVEGILARQPIQNACKNTSILSPEEVCSFLFSNNWTWKGLKWREPVKKSNRIDSLKNIRKKKIKQESDNAGKNG
jgi:hypothetical protein